MKRRASHPAAALLVAAALLSAACDANVNVSVEEVPTPSASRDATPSEATPSEREATEAPLKVFNNAFDRSHRRVARAIRDLKTAGMWKKLISERLYVIEIQSREGVARVPDDKHLADATLQGYIDDEGSGGRCYILFYPVAIERDLVAQQEGFELGFWDEPPSLRQFWAAVLGHELGHCLDWDGGESVAEKWEARTLEALRAAGIP